MYNCDDDVTQLNLYQVERLINIILPAGWLTSPTNRNMQTVANSVN